MLLNGKEYKLKVSGGTLLTYKEEFKKNIFETMKRMSKEVDYYDLFEVLYAILKSGKQIDCSFEEFMYSLNPQEVLGAEQGTEIFSALTNMFSGEVEPKKK